MIDYKARWLVADWQNATPEDKADRRQFGPNTREAIREAHRVLGLPVPGELEAVRDV